MCDFQYKWIIIFEHNLKLSKINWRRKEFSHHSHFFLSIYRTVIDTLKTVDENRKCFRLIGGVLCERTVKDVLPQLNDAKEQLEKLIGQRQEQLSTKGVEINKFREKHNIKIKGQDDGPVRAAEPATVAGDTEENRNHVLVANWKTQ